MRTFRNIGTLALLLITMIATAKVITTSFTVKGQCGECKENIEKALDVKGISFAEWDVKTKVLTVRYNDSKITEDEIHTIISKLGYSTDKMEADKEAESKLSKCCQPPAKAKAKSCCSKS